MGMFHKAISKMMTGKKFTNRFIGRYLYVNSMCEKISSAVKNHRDGFETMTEALAYMEHFKKISEDCIDDMEDMESSARMVIWEHVKAVIEISRGKDDFETLEEARARLDGMIEMATATGILTMGEIKRIKALAEEMKVSRIED